MKVSIFLSEQMTFTELRIETADTHNLSYPSIQLGPAILPNDELFSTLQYLTSIALLTYSSCRRKRSEKVTFFPCSFRVSLDMTTVLKHQINVCTDVLLSVFHNQYQLHPKWKSTLQIICYHNI